MYKVVILYIGKAYEQYRNCVKFEEMKGNINVVAVAVERAYADSFDGWNMMEVGEALKLEWDYLIIGGAGNFRAITELLVKIGISEKRILPISVFGIPCFDFDKYVKLIDSKVSIISNNCWGGITYHSLQIRFLSPFINMYLEQEDYIRLLNDIKNYMKEELHFDRMEYEPNLKRDFPVARIGDVYLYFNHYKSYEEAEQKWEERKKRINFDNLFVEFFSTDRKIAKQFDELSFEKKIVFTPCDFNIKSEVVIDELYKCRSGKSFYEIVNGLAFGEFAHYNVLKLLLGEKNFYRT